MKTGFFSDPHCGPEDVSVQTRRPRLSPDKMRCAVQAFREAKVEYIVCFGDVISGCGDPEVDLRYLAIAGEILTESGIPSVCLCGNHDLCDLSHEEFYACPGINKPEFVTRFGSLALITLDACYDGDFHAYNGRIKKTDWKNTYLPPDQLHRLEEVLSGDSLDGCDIKILSHQCLGPDAEARHMIKNASAVRDIVRQYGRGRVSAAICGHYHPGAHNTCDGIEYLTLPAMCEGGADAPVAWRIMEL